MENYNLTRGVPGFTTPELHYMETEGGDILFVFTEFGLETIKKEFKEIRQELLCFLPSEEKHWGKDGIFLPLSRNKTGFALRIPLETQVDDTSRKALASSLSTFLWLLDICIRQSKEERARRDGEKVQLFSLATHYHDDAVYHGGALSLSVSPEAAKALLKYEGEEIPNVQKEMRKHHRGKFPDHDNRILSGIMGGVVRENGVLSYVTLGNCACMGVDGGKRRDGQGYYVSSHNVDTSWQQLNLVVGIAATWHHVRKSLKY